MRVISDFVPAIGGSVTTTLRPALTCYVSLCAAVRLRDFILRFAPSLPWTKAENKQDARYNKATYSTVHSLYWPLASCRYALHNLRIVAAAPTLIAAFKAPTFICWPSL